MSELLVVKLGHDVIVLVRVVSQRFRRADAALRHSSVETVIVFFRRTNVGRTSDRFLRTRSRPDFSAIPARPRIHADLCFLVTRSETTQECQSNIIITIL